MSIASTVFVKYNRVFFQNYRKDQDETVPFKNEIIDEYCSAVKQCKHTGFVNKSKLELSC